MSVASGKIRLLNRPVYTAVVLNQGQFYPPGDIWQCLETFLDVTMGGSVVCVCSWYLVSRDQDCCKAQDSPPNKELSGPKCRSAKIEKAQYTASLFLWQPPSLLRFGISGSKGNPEP